MCPRGKRRPRGLHLCKTHSKVRTKKPIKYIGSFHYKDTTKCALSCNKKRLKNLLEIYELFCRLFCSNLQCVYICREVLQKMIFFQTAPHSPFGKMFSTLLHFATNTL